MANMRPGLLALTARPMRPTPSAADGRPAVICFHVVPPSVDLYKPQLVESVHPASHGAWRAAHSAAKTTCGLAGSSTTSIPPVFSSLYSTWLQVCPPSVER